MGRFVLTNQLGVGGMAEVWEAKDELLHRTVAVKLVLPVFAQEREFGDRFIREARLAAVLDHPSILKVFDFGTFEGRPYIVTPILAGGPLTQRLQEVVPDELALNWLQSLASALDFAHQHQIIHRDVKAGNVLFDAKGNLFLTDFGIAKSLEETTALTQSGATVGTAGYMAPEQAMAGEWGPVGPRADQYSLAILAFRMITGRMPFEKQTPTPVILHKTIFEQLPPPSRFRPGLGPQVDGVFRRALAKRPEKRYESCQQFVVALTTAMAASAYLPRPNPLQEADAETLDLPRTETLPDTVRESPPGFLESQQVTVRDPERNLPQDPPPQEDKKRRPRMGVIAVVAAVAALGASGAFFVIKRADLKPGASQELAPVSTGAAPEARETPEAPRTEVPILEPSPTVPRSAAGPFATVVIAASEVRKTIPASPVVRPTSVPVLRPSATASSSTVAPAPAATVLTAPLVPPVEAPIPATPSPAVPGPQASSPVAAAPGGPFPLEEAVLRSVSGRLKDSSFLLAFAFDRSVKAPEGSVQLQSVFAAATGNFLLKEPAPKSLVCQGSGSNIVTCTVPLGQFPEEKRKLLVPESEIEVTVVVRGKRLLKQVRFQD